MIDYPTSRRSFLKTAGFAAGAAWFPRISNAQNSMSDTVGQGSADYTLRIQAVSHRNRAQSHHLRPRPTTANFPARCCASRKASPSPSTSSTTPTRPSSCTGMARKSPTDVDGAAEEGTPYIPAHGSGASVSRPSRRACASITPTIAPAPTSPPANTAARSARCTSSPKQSPAATTAKSFSS